MCRSHMSGAFWRGFLCYNGFMTRKCYVCKKIMGLEYFARDSSKKHGRHYRCRKCARELNDPNYQRKYRRDNRKRLNKYWNEWKKKNKKIHNAHAKIALAIKMGNIKQRPCTVCGSNDTQAHHPDYDNPLDVIWLCVKHHGEIHSKDKD